MRDIREAPVELDQDLTVRTRIVAVGVEQAHGNDTPPELEEGDSARTGVVYELEVTVANLSAKEKPELALIQQVCVCAQ